MKKAAQRFGFIDWFRGLACVLMIETHAYDAWVAAPHRDGLWWWLARMQLGGFPSRMFLMLAGVSLMLRFASDDRRGVPIAEARRGALGRGFEVLVYGLIFRVVEWLLGGSGFAGFVPQVLRVDILNCIGVSLMISAYVASPLDVRPGRWPVLPALLALLIAAGTAPLQKLGLPKFLPGFLAAYLYGPHELASFPLLPWLSYTLTGCVAGALWLQASSKDAIATAKTTTDGRPWERHFIAAMLVTLLVGVAMAAAGQIGARIPMPIYYPTEAVKDPALPVSYLYRTGMCLAGTALGYFLLRLLPRWDERFSPLRTLGQASMLVYVVHVELVYGRLSAPIRHKLTPIPATILIVVLTALMTALAWYRLNRWPARYAHWKAQRAARSVPAGAMPAASDGSR